MDKLITVCAGGDILVIERPCDVAEIKKHIEIRSTKVSKGRYGVLYPLPLSSYW